MSEKNPESWEKPEEAEAPYSLEDILNEFGGWSRHTEPEEPEKPEEPKKPEPSKVELPEEPDPVPDDEEGLEDPEDDSEPADAPEKPRIWQYRPSAEPEREWKMPKLQRQPVEPPPKRQKREKPEKPEKPPKEKKPKPEPVYPEPGALFQETCKRTGGLAMRRRLLFLLTAAAIAVTCFVHLDRVPAGLNLPVERWCQILLGLLLLGAFCAYDVFLGGIVQLFRLRPGVDTMLTVATVITAADGLAHMGEEPRLSLSALMLVELFFALWGRVVANRARRRSLRAVLSIQGTPSAAVRCRRAWGNRDCLFRRDGTLDRYVADLESHDAVSRVMAVYAPLVLVASGALAGACSATAQRDFLQCWATMLTASIPVTAGLTYWRPFAALARRLMRSGAALCGWNGVRRLLGHCCVTLSDEDLFPKGTVTMNGMKMFNNFTIHQVVGYTYAVLQQTGCGLEPVFHEVFVNQNGRSCTIDNFRRYEGGGVGAGIQGDVVLVGSLAFMRAMGVELPEGTNVRQAIYCAVNGQLAAVFALNYSPQTGVRVGLSTVLRSRGLSLVLATRDFFLTPAAVSSKYKIPGTALEYPNAEERARLSGPFATAGGEQAVILARDQFLPMAEAVTGGRDLYGAVMAGLCINLLSGLVGLGLTALLCWLGAFGAASPFNLMLYGLAWTLPALLLTSIASR